MTGFRFCPNQRFPTGGWTLGLSAAVFALFLSLPILLSLWAGLAGKEAKVEGFISEATELFLPLLHSIHTVVSGEAGREGGS